MLKTINNISSLKKALLFAFVSLCVFVAIPTIAKAQFLQKTSNNQFVSNAVASNPFVSGDLSNIGSSNILNATSNGMYVVPKYTGDGRVIPDAIRTTIYEASKETGIEMYRLAARIESESSWTEKINSSQGAMGYMQIIPATWKSFGEGNPYNAHDSIMTGAKTMVYTDTETKNRVESDTAYNAGTTKLSKAKKAAKQDGNPENWAQYLKKEAQQYPGKQVKTEAEIRAQNYVNGARVDKGSVSVASSGASAGTGTSTNKTTSTPANNTAKTETPAPLRKLAEPTYYKDKTINADGTVSVANETTTLGGYTSAPYDYQDAQYMLNLLKSDATPEEIAELIKKYPDTLGKVSGRGADSNYGLEDRVNKLATDRMNMGKGDNKLTAEEVEKIRVKAAAAYDVASVASKNNAIIAGRMKSNTFYAIDKKISQEEADSRNAVLRENIKKKEHEKMTNESCRLEEMRKEYQSECYSCKVVKLLIQTFMKACSTMYDSSKEAGTKLLFYGFIIWMVGFALKNVSSLTSLEPSNNINDLLIFLFKVLFAYICINGGLITFTTYIINPIMIAGADFGLGIIDSISAFIGKAPQSPVYKYEGVQIVSPLVINKIFEVNRAIDYTVSTNLVVGNAIICHSTHAGAWVDNTVDLIVTDFTLRIPNLFLLIVGASIWFCGFMMTLAVSYYLVDISYKIGFAILILPIVLGLWPFDLTKDKLMTCVSIVLKAAATFAFLAITASYGIVLIDHAYGGAAEGGINALLDAVKNNNSAWISQKFDITGSYFLILLFAYLYAIKLLPQGATGYVNKFFPDNVFGSASPMHSKLTQVTAMAKQATVGAAKGVAKGSGKLAQKGISAFKNHSGASGTTLGGNAAENLGGAAQDAGKSAQKTGAGMEKAGGALDKGGAAASKAGSSIMAAGKAKTATGVGAIVGVPMMALGAVVKGAGMTAQLAGKTAKAAGKATKAVGKGMETVGKATETVGKATNSAWNTASRAPKRAAGRGWKNLKSKFKK